MSTVYGKLMGVKLNTVCAVFCSNLGIMFGSGACWLSGALAALPVRKVAGSNPTLATMYVRDLMQVFH